MAELVDALDLKKFFKEYNPDCYSQADNYAGKNSLKGGMSTLGESSKVKTG